MEYKNINKCYSNDFMELYHCDCMELLKQTPDNYYSLALVDPPYGIGMDGGKKYKRGKDGVCKQKEYKAYGDSKPPTDKYYSELFRVSKNQIIWGANHFISKMPYDSSCWIVWDKNNGEYTSADCELAWTSFKTAVRKFKWTWAGMLQQNMKNKQERFHPNEKPVQLYEFCIKNYTKEGMKILDTHFGSGSIALAVDKANRLDKMNLHLTACEIDKEYIDKAIKRISESIKQGTLSF